MIYATGDLHGNSLRFQPQYFPEQAEMAKDDYMMSAAMQGLFGMAIRATIRSSTDWKPCRSLSCSWTAIMKTSMR